MEVGDTQVSLGFDLDPQLAAANRLAKELSESFGAIPRDPVGIRRHAADARRWWNDGGPTIENCAEATIPGPNGDIPIMVYRPTGSGLLPVFVYFHGGGFRVGDHRANDRQMREIAAAWGGAVVSADYSHLPEHRFPAAVLDASAVLRWVHDFGVKWGIDGDRVAFGGSSAGANVAFGGAVALGEEGRRFLRAGIGIVGLFDWNFATPSMKRFGAKDGRPNREGIAAMLAEYARDATSGKDPRLHVAAADPQLFPPTFLVAAELDALRDSSAALAVHLRKAGKRCILKVYPGMDHFFFGFSRIVDRAREAVSDIASFLDEQLPPSAPSSEDHDLIPHR